MFAVRGQAHLRGQVRPKGVFLSSSWSPSLVLTVPLTVPSSSSSSSLYEDAVITIVTTIVGCS